MIVWKPHPDVEAGLRAGQIDDKELEGLADVALSGTPANAALAAIDEVWTMTSTMGFEALLRGKPVTTLGMPFYAGWGLTADRMTAPAHPVSGRPLSPEQAVALLSGGYDLPGETLIGRLQRLIKSV